ncbi:MAG: FAD-dependent oxidoreductase [Candidatus Euphemobacter frigidus]|nr:FAD-dependent oxidoreductase [Candidatus Euphemobacter frigidus]
MTNNHEKVVIIGGGIAGRNVARELLRLGKSGNISLIKKETHSSYSPCGLPYVLGGEIKSMEDILFPNFDRKLQKNNVEIKAGTEVKKIELRSKKIQTDNDEILSYDHLVIATGRRPNLPRLPGIEKAGVYTLSDYEDGLKIYDKLQKVKKAVIIGGGFIGCEVATALLERGIETTLVEIKPYILPQILDKSMAIIIEKRLKNLGARLITGQGLSRINGENRVESVSVRQEESPLPADLVLIAIGVRPETTLAEQTGFEIGKLGGLITDSYQHVKKDGKFIQDVYALGDCVEVKNKITGNNTLSPLTETAIVQARIVALGILGREFRSPPGEDRGYICLSLTVIGGLTVGMVGLTIAEAERAGIQPRTVQTKGWSREAYFPGSTKMHIKLLIDEDRLIGAQVIGEENVKGMINEISALIHAGAKIEDIFLRQRSYTPALSPSPDVLTRALEKLFQAE